MGKNVTLTELIAEIGQLPKEAKRTVLEGAAAAMRDTLDEHFMQRQSEPRKVMTPHDPNALPSEETLADAAREAAAEVVKMIMK